LGYLYAILTVIVVLAFSKVKIAYKKDNSISFITYLFGIFVKKNDR